jgi:hypothetical protein
LSASLPQGILNPGRDSKRIPRPESMHYYARIRDFPGGSPVYPGINADPIQLSLSTHRRLMKSALTLNEPIEFHQVMQVLEQWLWVEVKCQI